MKKILLVLGLLLFPHFAEAQQVVGAKAVPTIPFPTLIVAGNTYQVLQAVSVGRRSLQVQNNNAADSCYLIVGGPWLAGDTVATTRTINGVSVTAKQASILLNSAISFTRYYPYIPSDQLLITCATTGDSVYADVQ
jgi:hypothetical protein